MPILSFLWLLCFSSSVVAVQPAELPVQKIYRLPFVPILIGLLVYVTMTTFAVIPAMAIAGLAWPTTSVFVGMAIIFSVLGLMTYWAPIAWFVRTMNGDRFVVVW